MENRIEKAKNNHRSGYNCSQAVACAYCDEVGIAESVMHQMMEGCGLGMGNMEGTCGALCGAIAIARGAWKMPRTYWKWLQGEDFYARCQFKQRAG